MTELFFDVETTGLPQRNAKPRDIEKFDCCRIVSIAWVLRDRENVFSQRYSIVDTGSSSDGVVGASHIHGITSDLVKRYGRPVEFILRDFMDDVRKADTIVAHNMDFDQKVVASELYRMDSSKDAKDLQLHNAHCTMKTNTRLVGIKNNYGSFKWPKLVELHEFLFGKAFENAHNALADVEATVKCYYKVVKSEPALL